MSGILLTVAGFRDWQTSRESLNWPSTKAEVTSSKVVKKIFPPTRYSSPWENYTWEIALRYTVDGTGYTSVVKVPVVAPSPLGADPASDLTTFAAPGRQFTVRYDPRNPTTIVLLHGAAKTSSWLNVGIGALLAVVSFVFVLVLRSNPAKAAA